MNCAFHQSNRAVANCDSCGRGLCPACDHRVRGFPLCQDCIVAGVESLKKQRAQQHAMVNKAPALRRRSSPLIALVLSFLVPGLGAAYNGQTSKALVHFAIFASFFQIAVITNGELFFVLGIFATILFAAVDAYRTAQIIRDGFSPDAELDWIARRFAGNPLAWSLILVTLGGIFFSHTVLRYELPMRPILATAIVLLGVHTLYDYIRTSRRRRAPIFGATRTVAAPNAYLPTNGGIASSSVRENRWQER